MGRLGGGWIGFLPIQLAFRGAPLLYAGWDADLVGPPLTPICAYVDNGVL